MTKNNKSQILIGGSMRYIATNSNEEYRVEKWKDILSAEFVKLAKDNHTDGIDSELEEIIGQLLVEWDEWSSSPDELAQHSTAIKAIKALKALFLKDLQELMGEKIFVTRSTGDANYNIQAVPLSAVEALIEKYRS